MDSSAFFVPGAPPALPSVLPSALHGARAGVSNSACLPTVTVTLYTVGTRR